ncbi:MAG: glucosaminidase domain-containing protein [Flavobacteriaceae bacterium]|jgi:flagellar protein FlgJ|nr:glucosaminidase domain-containing protein [Flavobacteriaceae bacterium]
MTTKDFVKKYYPFAKEVEAKKGISAVFILAQSALETGWGKSAPGNMMFGVKAAANTPPEKRQLVSTTEILAKPNAKFPVIISVTKRADGKYKYVVKDWFRKYATPEESFADHAEFFHKNPRYAEALKVKENPNLFAEAVAKAGYATAPNYAAQLKTIIKIIEKELKNRII